MFVVKYFNRGIEETALATIILNIPSTNIEIFDKYEKVSPQTVPGNAVSKDRDIFSEYDPGSLSSKKR